MVRRFLIDRVPGVHLLPDHLHKFLVGGLRVDTGHIRPRHHDILSHRIAEIEYVIDHLLLIRLDHAFFMAHFHDRP